MGSLFKMNHCLMCLKGALIDLHFFPYTCTPSEGLSEQARISSITDFELAWNVPVLHEQQGKRH